MVELGLGWQIARWPLVGSGQAADADKDTQSANATTVKLILRLCRDGYFMTDGALYNRKWIVMYLVEAIQKPSSCSLKSSFGRQSSCTKSPKMSTEILKESR